MKIYIIYVILYIVFRKEARRLNIYLNSSSTTKLDREVLNDFIWCAENYWHNPSDISNESVKTREIIKNAQKQIAESINALPEEIIFTSGGSESNNWAIKGYDDFYKADFIISTEIEHPSVYNTCQFCKSHGARLIYIPVDVYGTIDLRKLEETMQINDENEYKILVSIMFANNEIGTIQPIKEISKIVHKYNGILHVDAVQAYMHTKIDVKEFGIDMMSVSFHKFGGFKNCGFLYIKNGIELTPLIHGGHQFNSKRSGTENVPMIYAMGNQVERLNKQLEEYMKKSEELQYYILNKINEKCKDICKIYVNGDIENKVSNIISLTIDGINANGLISLLEDRGIYVSAGAACNSGNELPSKVLKAIGCSDEEALSTIRISFNKEIPYHIIDKFVDYLSECVMTLTQCSLTN